MPDEFIEKCVRPSLDAHCLGCHGRDGRKVKGGLNLTTAAGLAGGGLPLGGRLAKKAAKEPDPIIKAALASRAKTLRAEEVDRRKHALVADMGLAVGEGSAAAYDTAPRNVHVQVRGNDVTPGEEAPAVFPRVLAGESQAGYVLISANVADKLTPNVTRFGKERKSSGRLELAEWLTEPDHPLTARVFVNRVWQHHFGEGIVRSPDNFGRLGERPTHPELLDWLVARFVADGWSTKKLHRLILLSDACRMSTAFDAKAAEADPDNRYLWRYPRRRLEAEAIRDAMLATSGLLDRTVGGTVFTNAKNLDYIVEVSYDSTRRSLYLPDIRGKLFPMYVAFDFPDPCTPCGKRSSTVVAPQALYLLNNPQVTRYAAALGDRLLKESKTDELPGEAAVPANFRSPGDDEGSTPDDGVRRHHAKTTNASSIWAAAARRAALDGRTNAFELAFRMPAETPTVTDLSKETKETLALYGIDGGPADDFGRLCLTARRFSEAGVRFVQVSHSYKWDQHGNLKKDHAQNALEVDKAIAGLLTDLKRRDLLKDTLVWWGGEFGRTPTAQGGDGRDHNPYAFSMWLAGGGVKPGFVYGKTDDFGYYAVEDRVHMHDLHATLLALLGLDHERLTYRHAGRDFRLTDVTGRVVREVMA